MNEKKVLVIGAGLGGISAAIALASKGYQVEIFEKNDKIGGKLNLLHKDGFEFDLGPSIIILPHLFERLFAMAGRSMSDYVELQRLEPQWRSFFEDGQVLDLYGDTAEMERELTKLPDKGRGYFAFLEYSRQLYEFSQRAYLENGADSIKEVLSGNSPKDLYRGVDPLANMVQGIERHISNPHLRDMLAFFIKYVGSSSYDAPAFMNLLPYSQLGWGLWYVKKGMYELARAYQRLLEELSVKIHLGKEVVRITRVGDRVDGIVLHDGQVVKGNAVVSNMEVIPTYERLMNESSLMLKKYQLLYEPSASGLVLHLGLNKQYPQLAHHNFFFSKNPKEHFDAIHRRKELPEDPTIYLVCPTKTNPKLAPEGHEIIKILPHIPHIQDPPFTQQQYQQLEERVLDKLERMGLKNLRQHIVTQDRLLPEDLEDLYFSNKGSIYGVLADRKRNFALKAPKKSPRYRGLYFTGGSVNPGGGTCMVVLCGQKVAELISNEV